MGLGLGLGLGLGDRVGFEFGLGFGLGSGVLGFNNPYLSPPLVEPSIRQYSQSRNQQ